MNGSTEENVHILVLGDEKVGKTSIIGTLVSQHFSEKVPAVMYDVTIPTEERNENKVTTIMDSSSRPDSVDTLKEQIGATDVIVLIYDVSRPETFDRIGSYWLPFIEKIKNVPIILLGNKIDLRPSGDQLAESAELQRIVRPIMRKFSSITACLECSAKAVLYIQQAFYFAQKAVLYPVAPLFDITTGQLKPKLVKALERIFRKFDVDHDGLLNDQELNEFQVTCFGVELQLEDIAGLVKVLSKECHDGIAMGHGVALKGFLHLQKIFVEKNRPETLWMIVRRFGYDDQLQPHVPDGLLALAKHEIDQSSLLNQQALKFLIDIFRQFDENHDHMLNQTELDSIFRVLPKENYPWNDSEIPRLQGSASSEPVLTLPAWLALWHRDAFVDPKGTITNLWALGYPEVPAIEYSKRRKFLKKSSTIPGSIFHCVVLGEAKCGKSSILRKLLRAPFSSNYVRTKQTHSMANVVGDASEEKFLIMTEYSDEEMSAKISTHRGEELFYECDVICFLYDPLAPLSSDYVIQMQNSSIIPPHIPVVYVCTKSDLIPPEYSQSAEWKKILNHCSALELQQPLLVSAKTDDSQKLLEQLLDAAQYPASYRPMTQAKREEEMRRRSLLYGSVTATIGLGLVIAAIYAARRR